MRLDLARTSWTATQQCREAVHYSRGLRHCKGLWHLGIAALSSFMRDKLQHRCSAIALLRDGVVKDRAIAQLQPHLDGADAGIWRREQIGWGRYASMIKNQGHASRTVLVKAPGANGERGVLITYFEYNFQRLLTGATPFSEFTNEFSIIYSTSWSPTNYHLLAALVAETTGPVWLQACNRDEVPALERFHPRVHCLSSLPCDWLAPEYYPQPYQSARDIDLLVVANWAPFKRHWALFEALRELPREWKVVCVGQPEAGHTLADIQRLQRRLGAPQVIDYRERLSINEVTALQLRSKVGAVFSRHEGCCVAATETLMAGAALALVEGARVGPLDYINEHTGVVLRNKHTATDLRLAISEAHRLQPRAFAEQHLSCHVSAHRLNERLKQASLMEARPWTCDIETPVWRPYPRLLNDTSATKLRPAADALVTRYPHLFAPDFMQTSFR